MPDNTPNDWNADEQFWADAWNDMEGQLDQKMPVKKRRRRFIPFWLLGALIPLLAVVWLTFFTPAEQENGPLPTDTPAQTIPASPLNPKVSTEGDVPLAVTDPELEKESLDKGRVANKVAVLDERPAKRTTTSTEPVQSFTSTTNSIQTEREPAKEPQATERTANAPEKRPANPRIFRSKETKAIASIPSLTDNPQRVVRMDHYNLPPSNGRGAQAHPNLALNGTQANSNPASDGAQAHLNPALHKAATDPNPGMNFALTERISPAITKATYQPHLFVGGSLGFQQPGLGYSGGIGLSRKVSPRGRLTATLGYHVQQESVQLGGNNRTSDENASPSPITNDTMEVISNGFSTLSGVLNSGGNVFLLTQNLRLNLSYARNLGDKFYLSAGVGINLTTRADFSANNSNNPLALGLLQRSDLFNITPNGSLVDNAQADGESLEDYLGLRRLRYDLDLMAGYRLNRHFSVEAGMKHYVSPVLNPDNFSSDRWRGEVKLVFGF